MTSRGFTLIEVLVGTVLATALLASGVSMIGWARWAFDVEPATIDTMQRAREGALLVADAVADAGGGISAGDAARSLGSSVPIVRPCRTGPIRIASPGSGSCGRCPVGQGGSWRTKQDRVGRWPSTRRLAVRALRPCAALLQGTSPWCGTRAAASTPSKSTPFRTRCSGSHPPRR
ncbi:MAG: prepilin-type N-terminal cleavage/methylation domain-containing protein [Vicinamibacterales bacterium]